MPHVHSFVNRRALDSLLLQRTQEHSTPEQAQNHFVLLVADTVAETWVRYTGEHLQVGMGGECLPYPLIISSSMPADLSVNVTCWWKPERAPHFEAIRDAVEQEISAWNPELKAEAHLIVVGAPGS